MKGEEEKLGANYAREFANALCVFLSIVGGVIGLAVLAGVVWLLWMVLR